MTFKDLLSVVTDSTDVKAEVELKKLLLAIKLCQRIEPRLNGFKNLQILLLNIAL